MRSLLSVFLLFAAAWAAEHSDIQTDSPNDNSAYLKQRALLQSVRSGARHVKQKNRNSVFGPVRANAFRNANGKGKKRDASSAFSPTSNFLSPVSPPVPSPTSAVFFADSFFQDSKGKGKGSGGKRGKGSKRGGKKRGGDSPKKGKKRRSICSRFEFQSDRRHLQYEGADCENNVFDMVSRIDELSIFASLLESSGIADIFSCGGPFTVLAPVDDAFDGVDFSTVSPQSVEEFLFSHIVPGVILEADFQVGTMESLAGNNIAVHTPSLSFNSATAIETDILSCNGVLFLTDALVTNFDDGLDVCGLLDADDSFSLFRPNPNNGRPNPNNGRSCSPNLLEELKQNSEFSLALGLLERAGLTGILSCGIDLTFLVPSNTAINAVDEEFMAYLLLPENIDVLRVNLLYHILPGRHTSSDLVPGLLGTAADGYSISVDTIPISFDGVVPSNADNEYCDGVIHVVDTVLTPTVSDDDTCAAYDFGGASSGSDAASCSPNLLDQARDNADLEFVVQLIDFVNLTAIFDCPGPFTGLFPSNDAIIALGQDAVQNLTQPENASFLREILLYHILPGNFSSSAFQNGTLSTLADDSDVAVQRVSSSNSVAFDSTELLGPDELQSCNGVGHIIGGVLFPRNADISPDAPAPTPQTSAPAPAPTSAPAPAPTPQTSAPTTTTVTVRVERFYMSFVTDSADTPTDAQYEALVAATSQYYEDLFSQEIPGFVRMDMEIDYTLSGNEVVDPAARFNLYVEFSEARAVFTRNQVNPTSDDMITRMVDGLTANFLVNVVRKIENSPFTRVNEGWVAYSSMTI